MPNVAVDAADTVHLLTGNEAIARGALEAGIGVASSYPGTPTSEIIGALASVAKKHGIYAEWSINEKVALEVAAAASLAGIRAIFAAKQNGLSVVIDFLAGIALTGTNKGLVLVVGDDPGAVATSNMYDSRYVAKWLDLPCLEPANSQEAKDMTKWAFELSEETGGVVLLRTVLRVCHGRGNVNLGELQKPPNNAYADPSRCWWNQAGPVVQESHKALDKNLVRISQLFDRSPFNRYVGPREPELLVFTSGVGWSASLEAVKALSLENSVGIMKLGTVWPLPKNLVTKHMLQAQKILVVEESFPFLENSLRELSADLVSGRTWTFYGKNTKHISKFGEITSEAVIKAIADILGKKTWPVRDADYEQKVEGMVKECVVPRQLQFCAGCPHRGAYWALKEALKQDGRDVYICGDIGCYSMAIGSTGWYMTKTQHAMGSATGIATGLGKLGQFGFKQPVIATSGDSTFFHASLPALINGVANSSDFILIVFDNSATAMTGFQSHPGTGTNAVGDPAPKIDIKALCRALSVPVVIFDPYDVKDATQKFLEVLRDGGKPRVVISRQICALVRGRREKSLYRMDIDPEKCNGCRICVREFRCPGLVWDKATKKAKIDEAICIGCGVCVDICKDEAITREEN
ncbi:thiamine pyrophosphate-dependent enzyme [Chloroflexota bacterium]